MIKLRRCSPEIERELHDLEARIRELEGRINRADRYLALGSPNGAREALAPPDSEPAEGEDDPRKDCPWKCGPDDRHCLCLAKAREKFPQWPDDPMRKPAEEADLQWARTSDGRIFVGYNPRSEEGGFHVVSWAPDWINLGAITQRLDDTAEQQDAMLKRREALEAFEALANGGWMLMKGVLRRENEDKVRHYLSRTSDEGTGCVVPEAVRRLPEDWRREAEELGEHAETVVAQTMAYRMLGRAAQMRKSADELDRAIAEQGGQRVPDRMLQPTVMGAGVSEHAYIKGWNDCREAMLAAPQSDQEGE